jgi:dihydrofolate reductase
VGSRLESGVLAGGLTDATTIQRARANAARWKLPEAAVSAQTPIARLIIITMESDVAKKIVVTEYISLDGVIEDPVGMENSGLGNWTGPFSRGPEGDRFKREELFAAEALIFGRATYEAFAAAWPHIKDESGYADRINTLPKYMASSTLKSASWGQTTIWNGDLAAAAKALKAEGDGEILIFGSASIVHQLAPHGLVDEYRLMIYPTILGAGKRLFPDGAKSQLSLAECQQLGGCIVLTRYTAV